jgi:hypothetical protein
MVEDDEGICRPDQLEAVLHTTCATVFAISRAVCAPGRKESATMKAPLYLLMTSKPSNDRVRCCDDRPTSVAVTSPAWPLRWGRKSRVAVPAAIAVLRRQLAQPIAERIAIGTPVVSSGGRQLGVVRDVVVELGSGRTSYAVSDQPSGRGNVRLLPRDLVRTHRDVAVVEEHVLQRLERQIA